VPLTTLILFTVIPLFFMIFVAFTNYDGNHMPPNNLFTWVGNENFSLAQWFGSGWQHGQLVLYLLECSLVDACSGRCLATFSNFFLGMVIAMIINKKGLKLKKVWRTLLGCRHRGSAVHLSHAHEQDARPPMAPSTFLLEEMGILNARTSD
jgi:arabinogalactan oligomer/maltooligosaccharide transport system permease protein